MKIFSNLSYASYLIHNDLVFIALHGRGGEDGYIQEILERNSIQFTGSDSKSCEISMNKCETKKIWR